MPERTTNRLKAWRNLMVAAINAGLEQELFGLRPGDNRWPGANDRVRPADQVFSFSFLGRPALGSVRDAGWDELSIHACYLPTPEARWRVPSANAGFLAGEAWAMGWLERRDGTYLQTASTTRSIFRCRRNYIDELANADIAPAGFADHGRFRL